MQGKKIAIVGTVGVPVNYGGFETLVGNLVKYHTAFSRSEILTVYCSSRSYPEKKRTYLSARLRYMPLNANGVQSIPYDICSLFSAVWGRSNVILLLGVSGALVLPLIRIISSARVITNIDGIEWRRQKWRGLAKWFLRRSEKMAVHYSHDVIADNTVIADYIRSTYDIESHVIAYGGDHVLDVEPASVNEYGLPHRYAFSVCRIEPENNIHMIVEAFSRLPKQPLVLVGNWESSDYGRSIRARFKEYTHLFLLDPIYHLGKLYTLRSQAFIYLHGHSAGGTNPSLVEAMHFGLPILAYDCGFNRSTTENKAIYFSSADELVGLVTLIDTERIKQVGQAMLLTAGKRYTWSIIAQQYFSCLEDNNQKGRNL